MLTFALLAYFFSFLKKHFSKSASIFYWPPMASLLSEKVETGEKTTQLVVRLVYMNQAICQAL